GLAVVLVVPGGARGLLAAAAVACVLVALGWLLPQASLLPLAAEARSDVLEAAVMRFAEAPVSAGDLIGWTCAGIGVLLLLDTALTGQRPLLARSGHAAAVLVLLALAFLANLSDVGVRQAMQRLAATPVESLPAALFSERHRGEITICGTVARGVPDVMRACSGSIVDGRVPEARFAVNHPGSGRQLSAVHDLPTMVGVAFDLALPLVLVVTFALLVHQAAKLFAHDIIYRLTGRTGTGSGRLAMQRLAALGLIAMIALGVRPAVDGELARALASLALFLAAAVPVPLVILARWGRADSRAALCGLASSLIAGVAFWTGYLPSGPGYLAGTAAGLCAGMLAALVFPARSPHDRVAADILAGKQPGPLFQDKSA
ncbi:MAG TPA: hypothetical protein PLQ11_04760, partial [Beijerinckiaceae bacterium]|nr:hypothetical protein [Beijerinckiaceae bacterium]